MLPSKSYYTPILATLVSQKTEIFGEKEKTVCKKI